MLEYLAPGRGRANRAGEFLMEEREQAVKERHTAWWPRRSGNRYIVEYLKRPRGKEKNIAFFFH